MPSIVLVMNFNTIVLGEVNLLQVEVDLQSKLYSQLRILYYVLTENWSNSQVRVICSGTFVGSSQTQLAVNSFDHTFSVLYSERT